MTDSSDSMGPCKLSSVACKRERSQASRVSSPAMYLEVQGNTMILPTGGKGRNKAYPNIVPLQAG